MRGQRLALAAPYPGKDPVPIVQEAGWAPGLVWTGAESLAPSGIRSPDRPARRQSLYRLSYLALGLQWNDHLNFLYSSFSFILHSIRSLGPVTSTSNILHLNFCTKQAGGPGSVVGIATVYRLDGPGIESRW